MVKVIFFLLLCTPLIGKPTEDPFEVWGVDSSFTQPVLPQKPTLNAPQKMIRFFQVYISPIDGPRSSYLPTSSQYTLQAIGKYGFFKGVALGCDRLMRENGYHWVYETKEIDGFTRKLDPVR